MARTSTTDNLVVDRRIATALINVINETPKGALFDALYKPLEPYRTVEQIKDILDSCVLTKRISRRGNKYYPAKTERKTE